MNIESIILIIVRALGTAGKAWIEALLCKVDKVVRDSPTELDNELWLNILLPALKAHDSSTPPPGE